MEGGDEYAQIAKRTIGRWAGDPVALVGDYAEDSDLPPEFQASRIYDLCSTEETRQAHLASLRERASRLWRDERFAELEEVEKEIAWWEGAQLYRDITDDVLRVLAHELATCRLCKKPTSK